MKEKQFLEVALEAVKKVEPLFLKNFGNTTGVSVIEGVVPSLVSDADTKIEKLLTDEKTLQIMTTEITDINAQKIATVKSTWQIKDWKKVKTRV